MAARITVEEANRLALKEGAFISLDTLVREFGVSLKSKSRILATIFEMLSEQVREAQNEVRHIQSALNRMEQTCREGSRERPLVYGNTSTPLIGTLQRDLWALDGWVVSLLETDLTLVGFVVGDPIRDKVFQINQAMTALHNKRAANLTFNLKDPTLFEDYFKV